MTTVVIFKSNGTYEGFTCTGHAGFDAYGRDIVCASVSVLVINTINSIEELAGEQIFVESDEEEGRIECRFPDGVNEKTELLLDSMVMGLKGIEKKYGGKKEESFFRLIIKEV